jgi:hypothetical protein
VDNFCKNKREHEYHLGDGSFWRYIMGQMRRSLATLEHIIQGPKVNAGPGIRASCLDSITDAALAWVGRKGADINISIPNALLLSYRTHAARISNMKVSAHIAFSIMTPSFRLSFESSSSEVGDGC